MKYEGKRMVTCEHCGKQLVTSGAVNLSSLPDSSEWCYMDCEGWDEHWGFLNEWANVEQWLADEEE